MEKNRIFNQSLTHSITQLICCPGNRSIRFGTSRHTYTDRQQLISLFDPADLQSVKRISSAGSANVRRSCKDETGEREHTGCTVQHTNRPYLLWSAGWVADTLACRLYSLICPGELRLVDKSRSARLTSRIGSSHQVCSLYEYTATSKYMSYIHVRCSDHGFICSTAGCVTGQSGNSRRCQSHLL